MSICRLSKAYEFCVVMRLVYDEQVGVSYAKGIVFVVVERAFVASQLKPDTSLVY